MITGVFNNDINHSSEILSLISIKKPGTTTGLFYYVFDELVSA